MTLSCMKKKNIWPEYRMHRPRNQGKWIQNLGNWNDRGKHTAAFRKGPERVDGYSFIVHIIIEPFSMVSTPVLIHFAIHSTHPDEQGRFLPVP